MLDQHADTLEGDVKPPLVLLGNEGSTYPNFKSKSGEIILCSNRRMWKECIDG